MGHGRKKTAALRYDRGRDTAPRVTAAGRGRVAEKILETAAEHGIPVVESPHLASLLTELELYTVIPPELYQAAAEVLAFAYRLNEEKKRSR